MSFCWRRAVRRRVWGQVQEVVVKVGWGLGLDLGGGGEGVGGDLPLPRGQCGGVGGWGLKVVWQMTISQRQDLTDLGVCRTESLVNMLHGVLVGRRRVVWSPALVLVDDFYNLNKAWSSVITQPQISHQNSSCPTSVVSSLWDSTSYSPRSRGRGIWWGDSRPATGELPVLPGSSGWSDCQPSFIRSYTADTVLVRVGNVKLGTVGEKVASEVVVDAEDVAILRVDTVAIPPSLPVMKILQFYPWEVHNLFITLKTLHIPASYPHISLDKVYKIFEIWWRK